LDMVGVVLLAIRLLGSSGIAVALHIVRADIPRHVATFPW
jgi:hypothetical protein